MSEETGELCEECREMQRRFTFYGIVAGAVLGLAASWVILRRVG